MKLTVVKTITAAIFVVAAVTAAAIAGSVVYSAATYLLSDPTPATSVVVSEPPAIDQAPIPAEVQRFKTVEAYFKAGNPHPLTHRFGELSFGRDVSNSRRLAIIERDGGCCLVCGSTIDLEVDHRIALMNNGDNSDENLGTLCDECHKEKTRYDWSIQRRRRKMLKKLKVSK